MERECHNCGNYKVCYIKEKLKFLEQNVGMCKVKNEFVGKEEFCESWCRSDYQLKVRRAYIETELELAIDRLVRIKTILDEDRIDKLKRKS